MEKRQLRKAFNNVSRLPAVQYERQAKMRGLSQFYVLPDNIRAADLEDLIVTARPGPFVTALSRRVEKLNPILKKIPYNRDSHVAHFRVIMGVVSGFNVDDISYFMRSISRNGSPALNSRKKSPTKQMIAFIEAAGRPPMQWAPSRKTLEKICQRIKRKEYESKRVVLQQIQSLQP